MFTEDLKNAQKIESEFAEKLAAKGWTTSSTNDLREFGGYDLIATKGTMKYTFEIKHDLMAPKTGNVAVELNKTNTYTMMVEPSGLSVTTADYQVYKIRDSFYSISTSKLKKVIEDLKEKDVLKVVRGGDRNSVSMALVNLKFTFLPNSKEVK